MSVAVRDTDVAVPSAPPPQSATLFGSDDPKVIGEKVVGLATFVKDIVTKGHLTSTISGREFVNVEGWEAAGVGIGLAAHIVSCVPTGPLDEEFNSPGFVAVAELRNRDGQVISRAESSCERDESAWRNRNNYALRSMAQTRATGKVFRQVLGFVMTVAGYAGTPADEVPTDDASGAPRSGERRQSARSGPPADGAPARQAQAARSATQQPVTQPAPTQQASEASVAPAERGGTIDPTSIRTVNGLVRAVEATYGYNVAQLFRILNVQALDGIRDLGITTSLDTVKLYYDTDANGGRPAAAPAEEPGDLPFGVEDALPGREGVLEGEVVGATE